MPEQITEHPGLEEASISGLQLNGDGPILFQVQLYSLFRFRFHITQECRVAQCMLAWCPGWQDDS